MKLANYSACYNWVFTLYVMWWLHLVWTLGISIFSKCRIWISFKWIPMLNWILDRVYFLQKIHLRPFKLFQRPQINLSDRFGSFDTHIAILYFILCHMAFGMKCHKMPFFNGLLGSLNGLKWIYCRKQTLSKIQFT